MAQHPYSDQPDRAFWSRSVASNWSPNDLITATEPILGADSRVMSAGSCFAANIVPHLEAAGYRYVRTETAEANDRFGYELYSAAYGNIYTPRQWLQLIDRAEGRFQPLEDRWATAEAVIDPFRPGLPYPAESDEEFDLLTRSHLDRVLAAIRESTVFLFTLGLTESWVSNLDGAVFPACPGTIGGTFDPEKHRFVNFTVSEVVADTLGFIDRMRAIQPGLAIVLTVSPVPLVATATTEHVYTATAYSKSVLRAAAGEVVAARPDVLYFPAYEIVAGPGAENHFADDRRTVTVDAVTTVVQALLRHSEPATSGAGRDPDCGRALDQLSRQLAERECEEVMNEPSPPMLADPTGDVAGFLAEPAEPPPAPPMAAEVTEPAPLAGTEPPQLPPIVAELAEPPPFPPMAAQLTEPPVDVASTTIVESAEPPLNSGDGSRGD